MGLSTVETRRSAGRRRGGRFHEGHRPESANISEHPKTNNCYVNDEATQAGTSEFS